MFPNPDPAADKAPFCYGYPMVSVAADVVCFTVHPEDGLMVALVRRSWDTDAFPGYWALPGGVLHPLNDRTITDCARRELFEETRVEASHLELVDVYSEIGRDPRGERVISVAFLAVIPAHDLPLEPVPDTDVTAARWFLYDRAMQLDLAFDHRQIIVTARQKLAGQIGFGAREDAEPELLFAFLPDRFPIARAEQVTADITGLRPDRANFRKWIERYVRGTDEKQPARTRHAHLYERRGREKPRAGVTPSASEALGGIHALAKDVGVADVDLLADGMRLAPPGSVAFLEHILKTYGDHPSYTLKVTRVPDLRINDLRTGRVLLTLHWQVRNKGFACTCLAKPESFHGLDLEDLRPWANGPHQSTFRLDGRRGDDARLAQTLRQAAFVLHPKLP